MIIFLFTDFGGADLYVGQIKAAMLSHAPEAAIIDLLHEAPAFNTKAGAHLLAALVSHVPAGSITLAVVDPGVGSPRRPVAVQADRRWYVGPDNGLLSVVAARAAAAQAFPIKWRPPAMSESFHGRDLFAPVAAMLAAGREDMLAAADELDVRLGGADLSEIIYLDHYGNGITGLRAGAVPKTAHLAVNGYRVAHARAFAEVAAGTAFWYENSFGLIEFAANQVSAAQRLELRIGDAVSVEP